MCRFVSSFVIGMMALFALESVSAQAPQPPPKIAVQQATGGIDAIMASAGTWKVHGERFATPYSNAGVEDTTMRNECWKSGTYVTCHQYLNGESTSLVVYTYSDMLKLYTSYPIPANGQAANANTLQIVGSVWTFPWEVTQAGVTTYFRVVNVFSRADHIDYAQEYSVDNVHWIRMATGSETKVGE